MRSKNITLLTFCCVYVCLCGCGGVDVENFQRKLQRLCVSGSGADSRRPWLPHTCQFSLVILRLCVSCVCLFVCLYLCVCVSLAHQLGVSVRVSHFWCVYLCLRLYLSVDLFPHSRSHHPSLRRLLPHFQPQSFALTAVSICYGVARG